MMSTTVPTHDRKQFSSDPEGAGLWRRDAEPIEELALADAEEEELAELWARDPGNQGA